MNDNTKGYVIQAGFGSVVDLLTYDGSKSLCYCIGERWWDSTHTMHIAGRELTITPYDIFRLTGLRVMDSPIPSSYPSGEEVAQFHLRVIGRALHRAIVITPMWQRPFSMDPRGLPGSNRLWRGVLSCT